VFTQYPFAASRGSADTQRRNAPGPTEIVLRCFLREHAVRPAHASEARLAQWE